MLLPIPALEHHLHWPWDLQVSKVHQAGPFKDAAHFVLPEAVVRDGVLGMVGHFGMRDKVGNHEDAAGLEAGHEARRGEREVVEVVEAEADDGEVEPVVFGPGEGRRRLAWGEEVADYGSRVGVGGGAEALVVRFDHDGAQVDADKLGRVAGQDRCDGAGPAGVVEHADLVGRARGLAFEGGGGVDEGDAEPGQVRQ